MHWLAFPRRANQRFHVIQISRERRSARGCERILRMWHASFECLGAGDVVSILELPVVYAQVAVGGLHECSELVEAEPVVDRKCADEPEPQPCVNKTIESSRHGVDGAPVERGEWRR